MKIQEFNERDFKNEVFATLLEDDKTGEEKEKVERKLNTIIRTIATSRIRKNFDIAIKLTTDDLADFIITYFLKSFFIFSIGRIDPVYIVIFRPEPIEYDEETPTTTEEGKEV